MTALDQATLHLAKQLIACRSITPDDGGALALLEARLSAAGFACERIDRGVVKNLWARHGTAAPLVCLAGHVDVVPPGPVERWTSDPFVPAERDGFLFGRGAADMKVGVAAMTTAAERFVASTPGHRGSLSLLFTSDEEGTGVDGTRAVVRELQARGARIDACILGEPTSVERFGDTIKNGRRGSLNGVLTVHGVQCHIAYPERGRSPILPAVGAFVAMSSAFGPPFRATAPLIIPGLFTATFSATSAPSPSPAITTRALSNGCSFLNAVSASVTGFSSL